jgi:apolipoprotein N-acyltransferase
LSSAPARKIALAGLAGAAMPLAFAPFNWWWLAPLAYAVLFLIWRRMGSRHALLAGFSFGAAQFLFGIYWIVISVSLIGGAPLWLALLLMLGLVAVMALYPALVGWCTARWLHREGRWYAPGTLPALFVLSEWLRGWLFTGFGWLSPGYTQTDTWLLGYAPIVGLLGVGWAVFIIAGCLAALARGARGDRVLASCVIAVIFLVGFAADRIRWTEPGDRLHSVAMIQGATPQELKWKPEQLVAIMNLYGALTLDTLGSDLIIWPEAAIPQYLHNLEDWLEGIEARTDAAGSRLMLGMLRYDRATDSAQNAVFTLGQLESPYIKRHLVPYGEYFPVPGFVRDWMGSMNLPNFDTEPGSAGQPPVALLGEQIAVTICYEDVFGAEQLASFPMATMLVNVSNDAWFGDSLAAHQHLQIARMRTAEVRRWQLRSTNTGITAVIDPFGEVVTQLPQFEPGILQASVRGMNGSTPYIVWGNWAVVLLALGVVGAGGMYGGFSRPEN